MGALINSYTRLETDSLLLLPAVLLPEMQPGCWGNQ